VVDFIRDEKGNSLLDYAPPGITAAKPSCPMTFTPDGKAKLAVEWEVATNPIVLRPGQPITVIQLRAVRDCQIVTWLLRFLNPPEGMRVWAAPYFQMAAHGKTRLRVRRLGGAVKVAALENLPCEMPGPEIESIDCIQNVTDYPCDYWNFVRIGSGGKYRNQLMLDKGQCLGIVARSNVPVKCIAKIAGV
jgi:hypothetical protein